MTARAGARAVVFDVGNVLVDWDPRYLYNELIADPVERDFFLSRVATREWHFQHDAGRPFAETSAELIARHPDCRDFIEAWGSRWLDMIPRLVCGMAALVADLAKRGVPLFAITNFSGEFFPPLKTREAALFAPFRDIVVSGDEKLVKPDAAIYRLALRRFGLSRGEGLFVDDNEANIEAGEAEGFVGHHFVDAQALRRDLIGRGLL